MKMGRLLGQGIQRQYYYELVRTGIKVILNEGWRSFFRKANKWLASRTKAVREISLEPPKSDITILKREMVELLRTDSFHNFVIKTNNYCNLHCEHCTNNCDVPISSNNENMFRRKKYELPIEDLILFCERLKGIGESSYHHMLGGEVTMMPPRKVEEIIELLASYHRRMSMQTVGFNLMGLDKNSLNKIDVINLDDHGINHQVIEDCEQYLSKFYRGNISTVVITHHFELTAAMRHPINKGKKCRSWMRELSFIDSIIYPCCNAPWIMLKNNDTVMRDELYRAGWTIHNHELIDTLAHWRETIPQYVIDQCESNCWRPHEDVGQGATRITLKKNDIIKKPESVKSESGIRG